MYNAAALPVTAAGALAVTGSNSMWLALAGFALVAAGSAVMRVIPRKQETSVL